MAAGASDGPLRPVGLRAFQVVQDQALPPATVELADGGRDVQAGLGPLPIAAN